MRTNRHPSPRPSQVGASHEPQSNAAHSRRQDHLRPSHPGLGPVRTHSRRSWDCLVITRQTHAKPKQGSVVKHPGFKGGHGDRGRNKKHKHIDQYRKSESAATADCGCAVELRKIFLKHVKRGKDLLTLRYVSDSVYFVAASHRIMWSKYMRTQGNYSKKK